MSLCPHCGKDVNQLSEEQIEKILTAVKSNFSDATYQLLRKFALSLPAFDKRKMALFFSKILEYPEDDINFGVEWFLRQELHLKGKSWEYCVAIITRTNLRKILESNALPKLPT